MQNLGRFYTTSGLQASPLGQLHFSARWRACSHGSSCPRLDQEAMPWGFIANANGHRIRQISILWIITCGVLCWNASRSTRHNRPTLPSWRLPCYRYGMICHRSLLIRQSSHFDRMLLQLADTLNTHFNYQEDSWHSLLKRLRCWRKSCACRYYWIFRMRLHVHLKKWTLKYKLLYLLNHICYFQDMWAESACVNSVNLGNISATIPDISNFS